jgi:hypothetical protein
MRILIQIHTTSVYSDAPNGVQYSQCRKHLERDDNGCITEVVALKINVFIFKNLYQNNNSNLLQYLI